MYYEEDRIPYDEPDQVVEENAKNKDSQDKEKPLSK
ncbi:MAG: hypothetical protein K0R28_4940 [Paenibacillus sp.]|jgi:hypothetical protein|nr:hypothetical protein [Paenibacillus sp.]